MQKEATAIVIFSLILYPLVVAAAYFTQSHIIFQSRGASLAPPASLAVEVLRLPTPDGERLNAWWLRTANANRTVLYFQGNGTNISQKAIRLKTLHEMGVNALMIDYRGFGQSTGRIAREADIYADGLAAWTFLTVEKRINPRNIIIWGRSLGGGVAAEIAQFRAVAALVLESTFYALDEVARRQYWFLPTGWLLKFHFANGDKLKNVIAPIIIVHSTDDGYIPFNHAQRLYDRVTTGPRHLVRTRGSHLDWFELDRSARMEFLGHIDQLPPSVGTRQRGGANNHAGTKITSYP